MLSPIVVSSKMDGRTGEIPKVSSDGLGRLKWIISHKEIRENGSCHSIRISGNQLAGNFSPAALSKWVGSLQRVGYVDHSEVCIAQLRDLTLAGLSHVTASEVTRARWLLYVGTGLVVVVVRLDGCFRSQVSLRAKTFWWRFGDDSGLFEAGPTIGGLHTTGATSSP